MIGLIAFVLMTFSSHGCSRATPSLGPGQVAITTKGRPNGLMDAKMTDGNVVLAFVLEPYPRDGEKAGVKDCKLSFDRTASWKLLLKDGIKVQYFGKNIIADLVDACNKISRWGGVQGIGSQFSIPKNLFVSAYQDGAGITVPGTLWCGLGDSASDPSELGPMADVDACCRAHDLCPYHIHAFETKDHYWNARPHTVSHCDCDNGFFDCLKGVKDNVTVAVTMGTFFFNTVGPPCVKKEYGTYCKKWHWSSLWCETKEKGMAAISYNYLDSNWKLGNSVKEVLEKLGESVLRPIPPV